MEMEQIIADVQTKRRKALCGEDVGYHDCLAMVLEISALNTTKHPQQRFMVLDMSKGR